MTLEITKLISRALSCVYLFTRRCRERDSKRRVISGQGSISSHVQGTVLCVSRLACISCLVCISLHDSRQREIVILYHDSRQREIEDSCVSTDLLCVEYTVCLIDAISVLSSLFVSSHVSGHDTHVSQNTHHCLSLWRVI